MWLGKNGSFEKIGCKPTHTYQICLSVINIVELEEGVPLFFMFLHSFHKINHIYLQFRVFKTSLGFETYGLVQIKNFKTLKSLQKERYLVGRHFSAKSLKG